MITIPKSPIIYVDTNVLRDCITKRNENSIHIIDIIKKNKWECSTSVLSIMELTDIEKDDVWVKNKIKEGWEVNKIIRDRYNKNLTPITLRNIAKKIIKFLKKENFIKILVLEGNEWIIVRTVSQWSNLLTADAIHFATAVAGNSDLIITSDENFLKYGEEIIKNISPKMEICRPHEAINTLKEMGFAVK